MLWVHNLEVRYGAVHALKGVDIEVGAGEMVAVLGANGAGKSTLLKAVLGAVEARRGEIRFDGANVTRQGIAYRVNRGLALVPEGRRILVTLTVHENLLLGAYHRPHSIEVCRLTNDVYDRFPNLARHRNSQASCLSGGEQQMLAIARALVGQPRLLMLDEPSLGLSPLIVDQLFDWLSELNAEGLTVLLVEQNTVLALRRSHRAYVLELGRVAITGSSLAVMQDSHLQAAYLGVDEHVAECGDGEDIR